MNNCRNYLKETKYQIFLFAVVIRLVFFALDLIFGATYVDETMTALNAFEIAKNGCDIFGDKMPLYFDTWLTGGQSPMATYLSALSVKLLGETKFALKLPVLITNLLFTAAFFGFIDEVFENRKKKVILYSVAAISPWFIFSGALLLDCNYITFFLMFALYFLVKAIKSDTPSRYYFISMVFFGLTFYCYMAAVLFVPLFLVIIYVILLSKRRISVKNAALSVITVIAVSSMYIVLGLVTVGVIPRGNYLGFNLNNMEYYSRTGSLSFVNSKSFSGIILNFLKALMMFLMSDGFIFSEGINKFQFASVFGGLFALIGTVTFLCSLKKQKYSFLQKSLLLSLLITFIVYCFLVGEAGTFNMYRYAPAECILVIFEGIGIYETAEFLKRRNLFVKGAKKGLVAYCAVSLTVFSAVYGFMYLPQTKTEAYVTYADMYYSALAKIDELGYDSFSVYSDHLYYNTRLSAYTRYYYHNQKEFNNFKNELVSRKNGDGFGSITADSSITFTDSKELSGDCCIYLVSNSDDFDKTGYKTEKVNVFEIAYK